MDKQWLAEQLVRDEGLEPQLAADLVADMDDDAATDLAVACGRRW